MSGNSCIKYRQQPMRFQNPVYPSRYSEYSCIRQPSAFPRKRVLLSNNGPSMNFRSSMRPNYCFDQSQRQNFAYISDHQRPPNFNYHSQNVENSSSLPYINRNYHQETNNSVYYSRPMAENFPVYTPRHQIEQRSPCLTQDNRMDDVWIETISSSGRLYYYHAKTRETKWEKPDNVRIFNLQQLQHTLNTQNMPPPCLLGGGIPKNEAYIASEQKPAYLAPVKPFFPMPVSSELTPGLFVIPPPNFYAPQQPLPAVPPPLYIKPNIDTCPLYNNTNYDSSNIVLNSSSEQSEINTFYEPSTKNGTSVSESLMNSDSETLTSSSAVDEIQMDSSCTPNVESDVSVNFTLSPVSEITKISENDLETNQTCRVDSEHNADTSEIPVQDDNRDTLQETQNDENMEIGESDTIQLDQISSNQNSNDEKSSLPSGSNETDFKSDISKGKSRPVSSTPIQGSKWCVVWTGDDRVFFYNAENKNSVWQLPDELQYRKDVLELIRKPPTNTNAQENSSSNLLTKKVTNFNTQDNFICSFPVKKLKTEDTIQLKESEDNPIDIATDKTNLLPENKILKEEIPHDTRIKLFRELLADKKVSAFSTWEKELHKIVFDPRYLLLSSKERKLVYDLHIQDIIEKERNERKKEHHHKKEKFNELLIEAGVTHKTKFTDFIHRNSKDLRFKAIEKLKEKEALFNDFVKSLHKKESQTNSRLEEDKFLELLKEHNDFCKNYSWSNVVKKISSDHRFKAISDDSKREKLFRKHLGSISDEELSSSIRKEERINRSLRNREDEVRCDLFIQKLEIKKDREFFEHESTITCFNALLTDLIRSSHITWREARKILKNDHRWETARNLKQEEREQYFEKHLVYLNSKKKELFRQLLDETKEITLNSRWRDVKEIVQKDPRCAKFSNRDRKCEREFKEYIKAKLRTAKCEFKQLLMETKLITYKSKELLKNTNHLESIEKALEKDKRYLVLQCIEEERKEMLMSHIDKLHHQGPPPPPTAYEHGKR